LQKDGLELIVGVMRGQENFARVERSRQQTISSVACGCLERGAPWAHHFRGEYF
jgi:hypothetical protein